MSLSLIRNYAFIAIWPNMANTDGGFFFLNVQICRGSRVYKTDGAILIAVNIYLPLSKCCPTVPITIEFLCAEIKMQTFNAYVTVLYLERMLIVENIVYSKLSATER